MLSGITAADTVITTGAYALDDGTKVKIGTAAADKPDTTDADTKPGPGKKVDQ